MPILPPLAPEIASAPMVPVVSPADLRPLRLHRQPLGVDRANRSPMVAWFSALTTLIATPTPTLAVSTGRSVVALPSALAVASVLLLVLSREQAARGDVAPVRDVGQRLGARDVHPDGRGNAHPAAAGLRSRRVFGARRSPWCRSRRPSCPPGPAPRRSSCPHPCRPGCRPSSFAPVALALAPALLAAEACAANITSPAGDDVPLRGGQRAVADDVQTQRDADPRTRPARTPVRKGRRAPRVGRRGVRSPVTVCSAAAARASAWSRCSPR